MCHVKIVVVRDLSLCSLFLLCVLQLFVGSVTPLAQDCGSSKSNNDDNNNSKTTAEEVVGFDETAPTLQLACTDVEPDQQPSCEIAATDGIDVVMPATFGSDDSRSAHQAACDSRRCLEPVPPAIESVPLHYDEHGSKDETAAMPTVRFYGRERKRPTRYTYS
jgi:hypothetical protein